MPTKIIFRSIKTLSFKNLLKLFLVLTKNPLFAILTFWATLKTYAIAKINFPETHDTDGEGNAFRHALWNCLIMMYCCKVSSPQKSLAWTIKITNLHEDLFPNALLQRTMDLHNNQIGRNYFMKLLPTIHRQFFETSFFVDELLEKTKSAKIITTPHDNFGENLVYLEK